MFLDSLQNHEKLYAYKKIKNDDQVIVVINLRNEKICTDFDDFYFGSDYRNILNTVLNRKILKC